MNLNLNKTLNQNLFQEKALATTDSSLYLFEWPIYDISPTEKEEVAFLGHTLLHRFCDGSEERIGVPADQIKRAQYDIKDSIRRNRLVWLRNLYGMQNEPGEGIQWLQLFWEYETWNEGGKFHIQEILDKDYHATVIPTDRKEQDKMSGEIIGMLTNWLFTSGFLKSQVSITYRWDMHPPTPLSYRAQVIEKIKRDLEVGEYPESREIPLLEPSGSFDHEAVIRDAWVAASIQYREKRKAAKAKIETSKPIKKGGIFSRFFGR